MLHFISLLSTIVFASETPEHSSQIITPAITIMGDQRNESTLDQLSTVQQMFGQSLNKKRTLTLGETLGREVGVSSSYFGPNASRPIIRGLEGERVRLLQNHTQLLDASNVSQDHAVSVDPLTIDRIEMIRGPGTLLYGNSALGGVVNVITDRVPEKKYLQNLEGEVDLRGSSADYGRNGSFKLNGSHHHFSYHLDGSWRGTDNYNSPIGKIQNSFNRTGSFGLGSSYRWNDHSGVGAGYSRYLSQYGVVAKKDVMIALEQSRAEASAWIESKENFFYSTRIRGNLTQYEHTEIEAGSAGTRFQNAGADLRVDASHRITPSMRGVLGAQGLISQMQVTGAEAFLPFHRNEQFAVFVNEEIKLGQWTPSLGARLESNRIRSDDNSRLGAGIQSHFVTGSASGGTLYDLGAGYALGLTLALTERSPNALELLSNGKHVATNAFELGNRSLQKELGRSIEFSVRKKDRLFNGFLSAYLQNFSQFIAFNSTGATDVDSGLEIFRYEPVSAQIIGLELDFKQGFESLLPGGIVEAGLKLDFTRGFNQTQLTNLPRISPIRETLSLAYKADQWGCDIELQRNEAAVFLAPSETATPAFMLLNLNVEKNIKLFSEIPSSIYLKADNLLDSTAFIHTALTTVKQQAPLLGRNVALGLRARF